MSRNFRYWAQKVLPLVYDESLSYYEILCKIIEKINEIEEVWDPDKINEFLTEALDEYLDTLDIYDEVMQNLSLYFADVMDYAADNTGSTDSTTAFANAIASGKGVIVVPPGQYIVNNLIVPSNKTIIGYGAELVANDAANGKPNIIRNNNTANDTRYNGDSNIKIEGLSFSAPSLNTCTLLAFGHCNNVIIKNCRFHHWNGWHGIEFCGASNCLVEGCTFDNYGSATGVFSECVQLDYMHEEATFPWFGPYNDTDCENIKIINNTFLGLTSIRDNSGSPYNYLYSAIGSHTPREGYIRNILIDGNYIENFYNGLNFYDLYDSNICNNIIKGCYIGMFLSHYIVRNNICNNNINGLANAGSHPDTWRGIAVYRPNSTRVSRDNFIDNNNIFNFTYGITYEGFNSIISNNTCTNCYLSGMMIGKHVASTQFKYNKLSGSTGDNTHKTLTINLTDEDSIPSQGLSFEFNIADYCYINVAYQGSRSYVRDNQFNGGITYGSDGSGQMAIFRNLVSGKYNDGLRVYKSSGDTHTEASTWLQLGSNITLKRGGVYLITASAAMTTTNTLMTINVHVPGDNNTGSVVSGSTSAGYTATATLIHSPQYNDTTLDVSVWTSNAATINNWNIRVVDLAVSPI